MNPRSTIGRARRGHRPARIPRGISLIEVLVVLVLFSFGLIGMVGLQARALQTSVSAEDSARAALLANDIAAQMWTARSVTLDADVIEAWADRVADPTAGGLPNGVGTVTVDAGIATVAIAWRAPSESEGSGHVYRTQVQLP